MNTLTRGFRNAFRNSIRSFSIIVILGLSIGLALAMLVARSAVQDKITSVKSSIGNTITISPAGARGFQGGGEALTNDELSKVRSVAHVTGTLETLSDRLTSENTNLQSAVEAGTLGQRNGANSGVGFQTAPRMESRSFSSSDGSTQVTRTFTPPVIVTGTNNVTTESVYGGSSVTITSGKTIDPTADKDEAVIGKALAEKNSLQAGSTFTAWGKTITATGIYDAGNSFANAGLVMSLASVQRLSGQTSAITSAVVTVDSIDNLESATNAVTSALGDKADVVSNQDSAKEAVAPLESVKTISTFSLLGAVAAGAVIILLTMVMIVRERRREIGVFKAIGASNVKIVTQFMSEAVTLTLIAMIAGIIIGSVAANPITKVLINNSTQSSQTSQSPEGPQTASSNGRQAGPILRVGNPGLRSFGNNTLSNARNIQASVGWSILGYGFAAALAIAILGSAIPAFLISKIRPAEVMRAE